MNSNVARALVACVLFTLPAVAIACPVCFDPNETARGAFFSTAIFLTLLPLSMIVGVAWWMARRDRKSVV